ncbi:hypothetical protein [Sorangium cellulosum]|nr:hypothetical protein [Sorangium cellulosum]
MDRCSPILAGGVFNTKIIESNVEVRAAWEKWWYSQSTSEARSNASAGVGLPIGDFFVGGSFDDSQFEAWKQTIAGKYAGSYFGASDLKVLESVASKEILEAYVQCIKSDAPGVQLFDAAMDAESGIVVLYIKYNPIGTDPSLPVVQGSDMVNARLANPVPELQPTEFVRIGSELPFGTRPVTVKVIDPTKMAVFDLWTDKGSPTHNVRLYPPDSEIHPVPLIEIDAFSFTTSLNVEIGGLPYGEDVIHNAPPYGPQPNMVEYQFSTRFTSVPTASYKLEVMYAAAQSRPVQVSCNDTVVNANALAATTGGWFLANQKWGTVGTVSVRSGMNFLRISRNGVFPHIRRLRLTLI